MKRTQLPDPRGTSGSIRPQSSPPPKGPPAKQPKSSPSGQAWIPETAGPSSRAIPEAGTFQWQLSVSTGDKCIIVSDTRSDFRCRLSMAPDDHFVLAPSGFRLQRFGAAHWLIDAVGCQLCDSPKKFEEFCYTSQLRIHRRLYRALTDPELRTRVGSGRFVCKSCAAPGLLPSRQQLQKFHSHGVAHVTMEIKVTIRDRGHVAVTETRSWGLGEASMEHAERQVFSSARDRLRDYFENSTHPMESVNPNVEAVDTDQEVP